jgi:putative membrane protein
MFGWHGMWDAPGWFVMSLLMLAVASAVALAMLAATRGLQARGESHRAVDARAILDERFAKGEVDEDEYLRRREVLEHQ